MFWTNDNCFVKPKSTPSVQALITYKKISPKAMPRGKETNIQTQLREKSILEWQTSEEKGRSQIRHQGPEHSICPYIWKELFQVVLRHLLF